MKASLPASPSLLRHAPLALRLMVFVCGLPLALPAQTSTAPEKHLSEKVAEELGKLDALQKAKDWDGAIRLLDTQVKLAKPDSFDAATLNQIKAKVHLMRNELKQAVEPFEKCLALSTKYKFFKQDAEQETRYFLAQIYYQEATIKGISPADQKKNFTKAADYMAQWQKLNTRPNTDAAVFYASILFNLAQINLDGADKKVDVSYLKKAQAVIEDGMKQSVKVKDTFYLLMVAALQQQEQFDRAAEYLELLVKLQPTNKQHWQQLFATYYQLAQQESANPEKSFALYIRSILTMERAQALGHMDTPKDNFNLVGIYFNIQQHEKATELLDAGLRSGKIEDIQKNWEILAYSYQQINKEFKAIETLKEAAKRYPKAGSLYFQMAQCWYSIDKPKEAFEAARKALEIGGIEKPYQVNSFAAYMGFELRLFDEALAFAKKALEFPESAKDAQLARLKTAIEESIKERELNKKAIEVQQKLNRL